MKYKNKTTGVLVTKTKLKSKTKLKEQIKIKTNENVKTTVTNISTHTLTTHPCLPRGCDYRCQPEKAMSDVWHHTWADALLSKRIS